MADELQMLRDKLRARADQPGWKANVEAIKARIAKLEGKQDGN